MSGHERPAGHAAAHSGRPTYAVVYGRLIPDAPVLVRTEKSQLPADGTGLVLETYKTGLPDFCVKRSTALGSIVPRVCM